MSNKEKEFNHVKEKAERLG